MPTIGPYILHEMIQNLNPHENFAESRKRWSIHGPSLRNIIPNTRANITLFN